MDRALQELLDKQALHDLLMRYCRGVDRRDAELLKSVYHADARDEHAGPHNGDANGFIQSIVDPKIKRPDGMHCIMNEYFRIDGDVAYGESYFAAFQVRDVDGHDSRTVTMSGGRYIDRFERRNGEWRIAHRRLVSEFRAPVVGQRNPDLPGGAQNTSDLSYSLPLWLAAAAGRK